MDDRFEPSEITTVTRGGPDDGPEWVVLGEPGGGAVGTVEMAQERVEDLRSLLATLQAARAELPPLRRPASAVGARGTWTGSAADRLHTYELVPLDDRLVRQTDRAEQAVLDELEFARRALGRAEEAAAGRDVVGSTR